MSDLNIEQEKLEIIKWVTTLKDETSIERLRMLRGIGNKDDLLTDILECYAVLSADKFIRYIFKINYLFKSIFIG